MDELGHEIFKVEEKGFVKYLRNLIPKKLRKSFYIILIIGSFFGGYKSRPFIDQKISLANIGTNQTGLFNFSFGGKVEGANTSADNEMRPNCIYKFCSNFEDEKWSYKDRFITVQTDPLILKSPNTSSLPGATLFYNEDVGSFTMQTFITPLASPSANMVVAYGHFLRCIIGDGDYSKISCQINTAYPKAIENWSYFSSEGTLHGKHLHYQISPFTKDNELQIKFSMLKVNDKTQIEIKLNDQVPITWFLPEEFEDRTQREKVGIGLFTAGQDDVEAVFKQFQLDPHI